jgi:hypothetical protein
LATWKKVKKGEWEKGGFIFYSFWRRGTPERPGLQIRPAILAPQWW